MVSCQITVVRPWEWEGYCKAADQPAFLANERFRAPDGREPHASEIDSVLRPLLASDTSAAWSAKSDRAPGHARSVELVSGVP